MLPANGAETGLTFHVGLLLLQATDYDHNLGPHSLLLLLVQLGAVIVYKNGHGERGFQV
jgi:hypothetical protein